MNLATFLHRGRATTRLVPRRVREAAIAQAGCLLVCSVRDGLVRMPAFVEHYRRLGVEHFLVVDEDACDELDAWLAGEPDCSCWRAAGDRASSGAAIEHCNALLARHGVGKWCVTASPDEFLVFPHCEERGLRGLARHLDRRGQPSLFAVVVDAYGAGAAGSTLLARGQSPFEACPYFDRFNLVQRSDAPGPGPWLQGGVSLRCFHADDPANAPALESVPFVRWERGLRYAGSTHRLDRARFNSTALGDPQAVSGVLFRFRYVNLAADFGDAPLVDPDVSLRYRGPTQLAELGFMQAGGWF